MTKTVASRQSTVARQSTVDSPQSTVGDNKPPVIFLMGPTASGKTDLALALAGALADELSVEIISVDSTQVYRGLDIGSAKPSAEEQARVPHHLIDIRDPAEPYSAAGFRRDALACIRDIHQRGRTPLLVGGTMLYFNVLLQGLADLPAGDVVVRERLQRQADRDGWPALHRRLAAVDPETAARLHPNHSQRIARALEVYEVSGQTMTELRRQQAAAKGPPFAERYALTQLAISPQGRAALHERIARRFHAMLDQGFEAEVKDLWQRGDLDDSLPAIRAVGYRQMWGYFKGEYDYDVMVERGIAATRQLAKRQLTWLRRWPDLAWIDTETAAGQARPREEILRQTLNYLGARPI